MIGFLKRTYCIMLVNVCKLGYLFRAWIRQVFSRFDRKLINSARRYLNSDGCFSSASTVCSWSTSNCQSQAFITVKKNASPSPPPSISWEGQRSAEPPGTLSILRPHCNGPNNVWGGVNILKAFRHEVVG